MEPEGILHRSRGIASISPSHPHPPPPPLLTENETIELSFGSAEVSDGIPESLVEEGVEADSANQLGGVEALEFDEEEDERSTADRPDGLFFHEGFLSFASRDCHQFPAELLVKFASKTKKLDLSFNRLVGVKGLECFVDLEELILDNNELTDDVNFPNLAKLATLSVNKNRVVDLDRFVSMCRWKFPSLTFLSLVGNACCPNLTTLNSGDEDDLDEYQRYRYAVLHKIPNLKFLDFTPVADSERTEAAKRGKFLATVKVDEQAVDSLLASSASLEAAAIAKKKGNKSSDSTPAEYSPLPTTTRADRIDAGGVGGGGAVTTKEAYGKCRYVYYGKQSEGNRFIANDTL